MQPIINLLLDSEPEILDLKGKQKQQSMSDSDIAVIASTMKKSMRMKKKTKKVLQHIESGSESDASTAKSIICVTHQLTVAKIIMLTEIPSIWTIYNGAYILDLSDDPHEWNDPLGNPLSIAAVIKSQVSQHWSTSTYKIQLTLNFKGPRCLGWGISWAYSGVQMPICSCTQWPEMPAV